MLFRAVVRYRFLERRNGRRMMVSMQHCADRVRRDATAREIRGASLQLTSQVTSENSPARRDAVEWLSRLTKISLGTILRWHRRRSLTGERRGSRVSLLAGLGE